MALSRFFCLGGGPDPEWAQSQYGGHASNSRARVLDLLADELEERFASLGPAAAAAAGRSASHSQDIAVLNRRLFNANLPPTELSQCRELLRKLAAIDAARTAAEAEHQHMAAQLKSAEGAHRQAEFARARAEAIATARGEALMNAQRATREAEQENMQLAELVRHCLDRLGLDADFLDFKPSPLPALPPGTDGAALSVRQSVFSKQQLASLAASVSRLPRQSVAALPPLQEHNGQRSSQEQLARWEQAEAVARAREHERLRQHEELEQERLRRLQMEEEQAQRYRASLEQDRLAQLQQQVPPAGDEGGADRRRPHRDSLPGSRRSSRERRQLDERAAQHGEQEHERGGRSRRASLDADQLSGFTVYTNELEVPPDGPDVGEVAQVVPVRPAAAPTGGAALRDSQGSGCVQWRSISSAAVSARSGASDGAQEHDERAAAAEPQAQRRQQRHSQEQLQAEGARQSHNSLRGSRGSTHQRQVAGSQEQAGGMAPPDFIAEQGSEGAMVRRHVRQLSRLVLPDLNASQLDSLVRIGASMQSPDQHLLGHGPRGQGHSPVDVVQQLLPPQWEQAVAQLDSSVNPLQSNDNAQAFLAELHAEWMRQSCADALAGAGGAGGGEPGHLGLRLELELPDDDFYAHSKYPGAGTWVSPSLAAMLAHKKGYNPLLDGGEPSPPSHIKAVFGTTADKEFYGPMAAHLNRQDQPMPAAAPPALPPPHGAPRPPASLSAESIQGPARQVPSNRSSFDGGRSADPVHLHQQQHCGAGQAAVAALPQGAGPQEAAPQRRQVALRSGFQPMGMHAHASTALSQQLPQPPRRSSIAVSELGGGSQRSSHENLAAAGKGAGLPPRGQQQQEAAAGKRSLESLRASVSGRGATAHSIQASLQAVDAAMASLRSTNPHLSRDDSQVQHQQQAAPAPQQHSQQQLARQGSGAGVGHRAPAPRPGAHHARNRSLPEVAALDLPLQQQAAAAGAGQARRTYRQ